MAIQNSSGPVNERGKHCRINWAMLAYRAVSKMVSIACSATLLGGVSV
jgi:hypothetical protein